MYIGVRRSNTTKLTSKHYAPFEEFETLEAFLPSMRYVLNLWGQDDSEPSSASTLTLQSQEWDEKQLSSPGSDIEMNLRSGTDWSAGLSKSSQDPLSVSPIGTNYTGLGCFPLGLQVTEDAFTDIVKSQRRLRKLALLSQLPSSKVRELALQVQQYLSSASLDNASPTVRALREFADLLGKASDLDQLSDPVQIYTGIDSGFHALQSAQFWSVYEIDRRSGALIIYVSKNAQNFTSTVLHTYLSSRGLSRYDCLLTEFDFNRAGSGHYPLQRLPDRMRQDLDLLSPTDLLLFIQKFKFSRWNEDCPLLRTIMAASQELLLDVPTFEQMKRLGNVDYLEGSIEAHDLIDARISWYRQHGFDRLTTEVALEIFTDAHFAFRDILHLKLYDRLDTLTERLEKMLFVKETAEPRSSLDPFSDIVAFAVFCAARKAAFEEVYVEVCDRNPLFNEYSDQSAAFAELFALGSRCDAYFDLNPSEFGKLLSGRYRKYYSMPQNQPPMWIHNAPAFASAYAAAQTDVDPKQESSAMPGYRRFTFLSVFAIPALIDITLLTTLGRGLYLSAYMNPEEQHHATLALMISLLLSGAIGTWISIGGTYYLISMAFSAANMFILTRLLGGLSITFLIALSGGAIIAGTKGIHAGLIFFFYLIALTAYLSILAALSSYQFPGSSFLNGRSIIIILIPTLVVSPIVTSFVSGYDSMVYLIVIYIFITLLILGLRRVGSWWVTWLSTVHIVDDAAVKKWYTEIVANGNKEVFHGLSDPAAMNLSRRALSDAVLKQRKKRFFQRSKADPLVKKLAKCWDATIFLLDSYCRLTEVKRPLPYSSTWNIEVRVAFDSLMQNQKGIRLHNSFIHWRNAGDEVAAGILYFLVALLDRWIELVIGGPLTGLSVVPNLSQPWDTGDANREREQRSLSIAVGFGLAYYLIGAVLLDYKAQHLHQVSQESTPITIQSKEYIRAAELHDAKVRRTLYWKTLLRFLGVHVWALSVCASLVWIYDGKDRIAFITFLAYVGAYSGLLLYQYNKIFSGPHATKPLLVAVLVGLPVGFLLKKFNTTSDGYAAYYDGGPLYPVERDFPYNGVIALAFSTWVAAILSFRTAKIGLPKKAPLTDEKSHRVYHAYGGLGIDQQWSHSELEAIYEGITSKPRREKYTIPPNSQLAAEIKALLLSCTSDNLSSVAVEAFPRVTELSRNIVSSWDSGLIAVELVSIHSVIPAEADIRALSFYTSGKLHILVDPGNELSPLETGSISSNSRVIAEILIHAASENLFGLSHEHALISESLLVCRYVNVEMTRVPERLRRALPNPLTYQKKHAFLVASSRELLRYLCYGLPCDTNWDTMPLEVRRLLLHRCLGDSVSLSIPQLSWLESHLQAEQGCHIETRMSRYELGAILAVHKFNYFKKQVAKRFAERKMITDVAEDFQWLNDAHNISSRKGLGRRMYEWLKTPFSRVYHGMGIWLKFAVIAPIADPEYQRELNCVLNRSNRFVRFPIRFFYTHLWMYAKQVQSLFMPWFIFAGRKELKELWNSLSGTVISMKPGRLTITSYDKALTAFIRKGGNGAFKLFYYKGNHLKEPQNGKVLSVSTYSSDFRLMSKEDFEDGVSVNEYIYEYAARRKKKRKGKLSRVDASRIPLSRVCVRGNNQSASFHYNHKGFIESGSYIRHGNLVRFKYHYRKNAKFDDELLRAEFVLPHLSCNVSWAAPPVRHPEKARALDPSFSGAGSDICSGVRRL